MRDASVRDAGCVRAHHAAPALSDRRLAYHPRRWVRGPLLTSPARGGIAAASGEFGEGAEDAAGTFCATVGLGEGFDGVAVHVGEMALGDLCVQAPSQTFEGIEVRSRVVVVRDGVRQFAVDSREVANGEGRQRASRFRSR